MIEEFEQKIVDLALSSFHSTPTPVYQNVLEFIGRIIEATAWPVVLLTAVLIFKKEIVTALKNIRSIKWQGAEATFGEKIMQVTETVKSIEDAPEPIANSNSTRVNELIEMAAPSPTGAIVEAWKDIEQVARDFVESSGLPLKGSADRPYFSLQRFLETQNLLSSAEINTFRELRMIRNRAAHSGDAGVTVEQARQYIRVADRMVDTIKARNAEWEKNWAKRTRSKSK